MSSASNRLLDATRHAVQELFTIEYGDYHDIVKEQCKRIAGEIGNTLAPQLYGSRIHGAGSAISTVIRCCTEALFWLELEEENKPERAIQSVKELKLVLDTPTNALNYQFEQT